MPASALDKVVTCAGEVMFERNLPTASKQEATLCEQIDLCILGRPEIPNTEDGKRKTFLISSLTKQVLDSPNQSMQIVDLIKNYAEKKTQHV